MSALILIELNGSEVSASSRAAITAASELSDSVDVEKFWIWIDLDVEVDF